MPEIVTANSFQCYIGLNLPKLHASPLFRINSSAATKIFETITKIAVTLINQKHCCSALSKISLNCNAIHIHYLIC